MRPCFLGLRGHAGRVRLCEWGEARLGTAANYQRDPGRVWKNKYLVEFNFEKNFVELEHPFLGGTEQKTFQKYDSSEKMNFLNKVYNFNWKLYILLKMIEVVVFSHPSL